MYVYKVRLLRSMVLPDHGKLVTYAIPVEKQLTQGGIKRLQLTIRNGFSIEYVPNPESVGE